MNLLGNFNTLDLKQTRSLQGTAAEAAFLPQPWDLPSDPFSGHAKQSVLVHLKHYQFSEVICNDYADILWYNLLHWLDFNDFIIYLFIYSLFATNFAHNYTQKGSDFR